MSEHRSSEFGISMSGLVGIVILVALVYALTAARLSGDRDMGTPEQIAARIAPVGSVNLAGATPSAPVVAAAAPPATDKGSGLAVYNKACVACHATGAAGAPKLGDKAAWEPRLAQGIDQLLQIAIAGKGAMPPRGTCMDCSDDDLTDAIEYMLVQVGYEPVSASDVGDAERAVGMSRMEGMTGMAGVSGMRGMPGMGSLPGMGASGMTRESANPPAADLPPVKEEPPTEGMSGMQGEPAEPSTPPVQ